MLQLPAQCEPVISVGSAPNLPPPTPEPRPILSLRIPGEVLYAEQIASAELTSSTMPEMIWVRPLVLAVGSDPVIDLQLTADLVWPAAQFEPAYAEDVLPLLEQAITHLQARHLLQAYMQRVWRYHQLGSGGIGL